MFPALVAARPLVGVTAYIPSPSHGILRLGPVPLHMYGLMLAIGVIVAIKVASTRWVRRGHDVKEMDALVVWAVAAGVVGARLYSVLTDYELYTHDWIKALEIWKGGLGIWGAVAGGAAAVLVLAKRRHLDIADLADSIAPGLVIAQAIGRWGNWFNQELFGRPTSLPWGLEISPSHCPVNYTTYCATHAHPTFQPTFLYESLGCAAIFVILLWLDRHRDLARGQVFALYVALYTFLRFFMENMRSDFAHRIGPLRFNAWMCVVLFVGSAIWYVVLGRRRDARRRAEATRAEEPASAESTG